MCGAIGEVKSQFFFVSQPYYNIVQGGGEIVYRDKKQGVPRVLGAIVFFVSLKVTDIYMSKMGILG